MPRARDPVTGQFLPQGGGGGKGRKPSRAQIAQYYGGYYPPAPYYAPPPPPPRRRRSSGTPMKWGDLLESALYSVALDFIGDQIDAKGVQLPLGLNGREAAGLGAMYYGKTHRKRVWWNAGEMNFAPAVKQLTGGLAGGLLGGGGATPPQLPGGSPPPQLPAGSGAKGHDESTVEKAESAAETGLEGLGILELLETIGGFIL